MPNYPVIPRLIWTLWLQGADAMPPIVGRCHDSWLEHNPGWRVTLLTHSSLREYIDLDPSQYKGVATAELSDVIRLNLLSRYGGVWVDATCLCTRSLDDWLDPWLPSGFFAFTRPGRDRLLSTWFLAAKPGNVLAAAWHRSLSRYLSGPDFVNARVSRPLRACHLLLGNHPLTARLWLSSIFRDWLHVYPFTYLAHYLFDELIRSDPECRRIWEATPKFPAELPIRLNRTVLRGPLSSQIRAEVEGGSSPVYKLTWKGLPGEVPPGSVLEYLLASRRETLPGSLMQG